MVLPEAVIAKLASLPVRPGCYVFRGKPAPDGAIEVLYVGKAKSLRARVRSYFQEGASDARYFIPLLQRVIGDLDTIVTSTEKEAAILENSLIKQYQPRYNVKLRDNKEFLSLRVDVKHSWPRLNVVRKPVDDGARYFGPYHSATAARRSLHLVNKHFQLRTCSDVELETRARPCLQHQIKRCPAPCVYEVDRAWYAEQVRAVELFLAGRHDELTRELERRMRQAATSLEFELAAIYRDQLRAVDAIRMVQRVVQTGAALSVTQDVVGLFREGDLAELTVLYVRGGRVTDTAQFSFEGAELEAPELVGAFVAQHYAPASEGGAEAPDEILLPSALEASAGVEELLSERRGARVSILVPQRGPRAQLVRMANDNARHGYLEKRRASEHVEERLEQLRQRLRLPALPRRIECCDISHLGGGDTVGSIVCLVDGAPAPKRYRSFHVRGVRDGDDYGAMYEVLARRFRRGRIARAHRVSDASATAGAAETAVARARSSDTSNDMSNDMSNDTSNDMSNDLCSDVVDAAPDAPAVVEARTEVSANAFAEGAPSGEAPSEAVDWDLPDLFVVDGGRGQLAVALAAARDLGLHQLPIVALAKEKSHRAPDHLRELAAQGAPGVAEDVVDRVYLPGQKNPIALREHSTSMFFLARARDEAHRFANRIRERLGQKRRMRSKVDDIKGVGPAMRKELLRCLGSLRSIERADDAALLAVPGFTRRHLAALRRAIPQPALPASPSSSPLATESPADALQQTAKVEPEGR